MAAAIVFFILMMLSIWGFQLLCFKYEKNRKIYKRLQLVPYVEAVIGIALCILIFVTKIYELLFVFLFFLIIPLLHAGFYYCVPYWREKLPRKVGLRFLAFVLGYIAILGAILLWAKHAYNIGSGV